MVLVNIYYKILIIMKQLNTKPIYRTYYVNGGIIYEIKNSTQPVSDTHAIIYDETKTFPSLWYTSKKDDEIYKYYLDSLITDGDKLSSGAFTKLCHECSPEADKTPFEYFKYLCEKQISTVIGDSAPKYGYKYYYDPANKINRLDKLGVPVYMFKQNYETLITDNTFKATNGKANVSIAASDLIDFTEAKYNSLLSDEILRRAKEAANSVAKKYSKKVDELTLTDM